MTGRAMTVVCYTLGMSRRTGYYVRRERLPGRYQRADDAVVLQQIHAVTNSRATYGYRRVWAMVNRTFRTGYNRKRIRRVMQLHGLMLPPPGPSAARAAALRPDPAAGVEPALVLRCVLDSLLEWRGPLGGLRDRLSRS